MWAGVLTRELPDGGQEFVLDDPVLARLVLDGRVTFRFGLIDVTVSGCFDLEVDQVRYRCDPGRPDTLAPLLALCPGTARWLWARPDGTLTLECMQGQRLVVPAPVPAATWSVAPWSAAAG